MLKSDVDVTGAVWKKSSRSGGNGDCVEVALDLPQAPGFIAVRDSKDRSGPVQIYTTSEWTAFTEGVRDGEFDL